jgi:hypothetical protein
LGYVGTQIGRTQWCRPWSGAVNVVWAFLAITLVAAFLLALRRWGADSRPGIGEAATDERLHLERPGSWW